MQYTQDYYNAQQEAAPDNARLFDEQFIAHERSAGGFSEHFGPAKNYNNQYDNPRFASQDLNDDMSHDPADLVANIPEPEASSIEDVNEDSQNFLAGPKPSEDWVVSTANKFHFQPNSMLAFYPRHVRKVVTKRKQADQSFDIINQKLQKLKAPRH